jgi:hypothetical protein
MFSLLANLRTFVTHYNGKAAKMRQPQSLALPPALKRIFVLLLRQRSSFCEQ